MSVLYTGNTKVDQTQTYMYSMIKNIDNVYNLKYAQQGWSQVKLTKYSSTSSIRNIHQVQVLVKYSFI